MRKTKLMAKALEHYGNDVSLLLKETTYNIKAFIQPMRYKNKMFLDSQMTAIGTVDESCFLYLGPPEYRLQENTPKCIIHFRDDTYMVVKSETVNIGQQAIYTWAILRLLHLEE